MFDPTRQQVYFAVAILIGLIVGKLIKNFKLGLAIAIILGLLMAAGTGKKNDDGR